MDTIVIADRTFAALTVAVDVPGDVTHRDTRPVAGESDRERVTRLAARAVIEGVRLYGNPASPILYATSSTGRTLYRIDPEARTCSCRAQGMCKHLALYLVAVELASADAREALAATRDDAMRTSRPAKISDESRCYDCERRKAAIFELGAAYPLLCPVCAWEMAQRSEVRNWPADEWNHLIRQLNARTSGNVRHSA